VLTVHKYPFPIAPRFTLDLPRAAIILKVECQGRTPCLWAWIDTEGPMERVGFALFGTGHEVPRSGLEFVSTFQMPPLVWHLFRFISQETQTCPSST
jgi:hypothetical protein